VRPVVKADAYGHGALPVALALEAEGIDGLCVAAFDEALELREGGVGAPILVLYPVPAAWVGDAARLGIAIAAGDAAGVTEIVRAAAGLDPARPLVLELEVETGLGRGGFVEADLVAAARLASTSAGVRLAGLWTHFQAVEDGDITKAQVARFESAVRAVAVAGVDLPARHAAASAGLLTDDVVAYDGVRPGLALYGLVPDELGPGGIAVPDAERLRPVMSLVARPVRVAELSAGWGVSYGPTFRTERASRIATLPLGYGDGWSRQLSNRASAIVRGQLVPLVGNVAMDAVMADVTDVPGAPVDDTDEFVLLGTVGNVRITAGELAQQRTTNSWEVVTAMARRLPRVYHAAAGPVGMRTLTERRG
jgi:alanine racemase